MQMGMSIAKFPFVRTLEGFDYDAQPSLDPKQIRELATCRWVANGEACCCSGRPASARRIWPWRSVAKRSSTATRRCSFRQRRWSRRSPVPTAEGRLEERLMPLQPSRSC